MLKTTQSSIDLAHKAGVKHTKELNKRFKQFDGTERAGRWPENRETLALEVLFNDFEIVPTAPRGDVSEHPVTIPHKYLDFHRYYVDNNYYGYKMKTAVFCNLEDCIKWGKEQPDYAHDKVWVQICNHISYPLSAFVEN